jgi:hypothetical protein
MLNKRSTSSIFLPRLLPEVVCLIEMQLQLSLLLQNKKKNMRPLVFQASLDRPYVGSAGDLTCSL